MELNSSAKKKCSREALETLGREPVPSLWGDIVGVSPRCDETCSHDELEWNSMVALNGSAATPSIIAAC